MGGWPSVLMTPEFGELTEDVRRLFRELDQQGGTASAAVAGQCAPALDVLETDEAIEIVVDLPGVPRDALRVLLKGDVLVVAGEKIPLSPAERATITSWNADPGVLPVRCGSPRPSTGPGPLPAWSTESFASCCRRSTTGEEPPARSPSAPRS